jgi:TorA maturation chaperone TorD
MRDAQERARAYAVLAALFRAPTGEVLASLRAEGLGTLAGALEALGDDAALCEALAALRESLADASPAALRSAYDRTFEPTCGLACPPHETAHLDGGPQAQLLRTYRLADVAGFYRAFGVEPVPGSERADHVALELEFLHLLAVKEAVALGEPDAEHVAVCREAARHFVDDHLGDFAPRLAARLAEGAAHPLYAAAGRLLEGFVARDAARLAA